MTEAEFFARAEKATRWADLEKLLYDKGGVSRSDCKQLVGELKKLTKQELQAEAKAQLPALLEAYFWRQMTN